MKLAYKVVLEVNEADEFTADIVDEVIYDALSEFVKDWAKGNSDIVEVDVVTVEA